MCVFWEAADQPPPLRKYAGEHAQIKQPCASIIYDPRGWNPFHSQCKVLLSFGLIKDPGSVSDLLHLQGPTPRQRHSALTADWSVVCFFMLLLLSLWTERLNTVWSWHKVSVFVLVSQLPCGGYLHALISGCHQLDCPSSWKVLAFFSNAFPYPSPVSIHDYEWVKIFNNYVSTLSIRLSLCGAYVCVCVWCDCVCGLVADWCVCLSSVVFHPLFCAVVWTGIG